MKKQVLVAWSILIAVGTVGRAEASSSARYLSDISPYDIDPKSWAIWRKSVSPSEWQEWVNDLNLQRWDWWRQSIGPKNWRQWKETQGPSDKALWNESTKMLPDIERREEQEEPAVRFKNKILKLKVHGTVLPPSINKGQSTPGGTGNQPPSHTVQKNQ